MTANAIRKYEAGDESALTVAQVDAIQLALERFGVSFTADGGSVKLKESEPQGGKAAE